MVRGASSGCPACIAEYVCWCPDPLYVLYVAAAATFSSCMLWYRCGSVFCICISQDALTHSKLQLSCSILSSYRVFLAGITEFGNLELQKLLLGSTNTCSVHELVKF